MDNTRESPILCLGLSCAIQRTMVLKALNKGEVNRTSCTLTHAGGKAVNVAKALNALKRNSTLIGIYGEYDADVIDDDLDEPYILNMLTAIRDHNRICTTIIEEKPHCCTEIVTPAPNFNERDERHLMASFEEHLPTASALVIAGSLPSERPANYYNQFIRAARAFELPVIVDVAGTPLPALLQERPFLVKLNADELRAAGFTAQELLMRGAQNVLVTDGANAVTLLTPSSKTRFKPPAVNVLNTIGCGDCVTAGFTAALIAGHKTPEDILAFALACGAANATSYAPIGLKSTLVKKLTKEVQIYED